MCMSSPRPQEDPSNPAPYPVNENYGQVTSNTKGPDGVVRGGWTIAQQHQANMKAYGQSTPPRPTAPAKSGATQIRM